MREASCESTWKLSTRSGFGCGRDGKPPRNKLNRPSRLRSAHRRRRRRRRCLVKSWDLAACLLSAGSRLWACDRSIHRHTHGTPTGTHTHTRRERRGEKQTQLKQIHVSANRAVASCFTPAVCASLNKSEMPCLATHFLLRLGTHQTIMMAHWTHDVYQTCSVFGLGGGEPHTGQQNAGRCCCVRH